MARNDEDDWILEGESYSKGWDCPTRWAVDSNKQCWMNDAHGGELVTVSLVSLLNELMENGDIENAQAVRNVLGLVQKNKEEAASILKEKGFDPFKSYMHEWLKESGLAYSVLDAALDILKEKIV